MRMPTRIISSSVYEFEGLSLFLVCVVYDGGSWWTLLLGGK